MKQIHRLQALALLASGRVLGGHGNVVLFEDQSGQSYSLARGEGGLPTTLLPLFSPGEEKGEQMLGELYEVIG